jgi:hypothetical protein
MFALMMIWNFASINSISKSTAELAQIASKQSAAQIASKEFTNLKNKVTELQKKTRIIEEIDSRINVASVLAEMSFLIDEKIVLKKVEFIAEKLSDQQAPTNSGSAVRVAIAEFNTKQKLPLGDVRFKVLINGIAADASDVAALVCKLEDSPYFCQVYPNFSRNKTLETIGKTEIQNLKHVSSTGSGQAPSRVEGTEIPSEGELQVSEFEISCYLANFCQDEPSPPIKSASVKPER